MALNLGNMSSMAIAFVVLAIVIGIGGTILTEVQSTQTTNGVAYNATGDGLTGITTFGDWLPTIAVILAAALVIGIVGAYFYFRG